MAISSGTGGYTPPGLVPLGTTTWSSASSTQFFDAKFTSAYINYKIILSIDGTNNDVGLNAKMRASSTPTSTNYKWVSQSQYPGIGAVGVDGTNAGTSFSLGNVSDTSTICEFEIFRPQIAAITVIKGNTNNIQTTYGNTIQWFEFRGHLNDTTVYDGMEFIVSGGTFTGSATIYGYRI